MVLKKRCESKENLFMEYTLPKIISLVGHYGCGKTNLAANLALEMSRMGKVTVVDMDIVNPYFRTADFKEEFEKRGINIAATQYANTNLDIPVLNFDMAGIIDSGDYTIIDAGGGSDGAAALGRYREVLKNAKAQLFYVFNMYRGLSVQETAEALWEIECSCKMKCTSLINNSNLGNMTTAEDIYKTEEFEKELVNITGVPIFMRCVPKCVPDVRPDDFYVERLVKMPWEASSDCISPPKRVL